jgi:uncharacterized protein (TIGR00299 family) protein
MVLGALLELGVPTTVVERGLAALGIPGLRMHVTKVKRGAIAASYVSFSGPERDPSERRFRSIRSLLEEVSLSERVRDRALRVFKRLAEAEARVHGNAVDDVHFHEAGSVDALGDIVGVSLAFEHLEVDEVTASPLALGTGFVDTEHGRLPLPAPATVELLRGIPTYPVDVTEETLTPTGAALLCTFVARFGPMPPLAPSAQGFGAGDDRRGALPNVLRGILGTTTPLLEGDVVTVLETNLDDMNPEHLPYLIEELMTDGALDASLSPLSMKRGRPGQLLRVIARPVDRDRLAQRILVESSAIGVRYQDMPRLKLVRQVRSVTTGFGVIPVKVVRTPDGRSVVSPEYEACARAAREHGVPLQRVYHEAALAAEAQLR